MPAGAMIYAGEIARILYAFETAGRGPEGWVAAEAALRLRFPGAATNSIDAVMERAREVWQTGQNYRQGNPSYTPSRVPDVRRLEREDPTIGLTPGGPGRRGRFYHEGIIEIIDPSKDDAVIQRFGVTIPDDELLSREQFEQMLRDRGGPFFDRFINYDPERLPDLGFDWRIRIGGVYQGF